MEGPDCEDPPTTPARINSRDVFQQIVDIAGGTIAQNRMPLRPGGTLIIRCDPAHPALHAVLRILESEGLKPSFEAKPLGSKKGTEFYFRILRTYTAAEYDSAEYLWLPTNLIYRDYRLVAYFARREGGRWVAKASEVLGQSRRAPFGGVGEYNYFVNTKLREKLESAGLKGLRFYPLLWDEPSKVKQEYWEIDSEVLMPPCLLPVIRFDNGFDKDGKPAFAAGYDEGCYDLIELVFRRSAVSALPEFDIAWTREDLPWSRPDIGHRRLVVSQRCRQVFNALGMRPVEYGMVRLVGDDWQPKPHGWEVTEAMESRRL